MIIELSSSAPPPDVRKAYGFPSSRKILFSLSFWERVGVRVYGHVDPN
jgi:hypothetical protein